MATWLAAAGGPAERLADTGLYASHGAEGLAPGVLPFAPQYPLWSDGATKRRWMWLPPGTAIDARRADAWVFPVGTRFWKEFSFQGRRVETRTLERTRAGWRFAAYVWDADGRAARLAPERGLTVDVAPGVRHTIPGRGDCRVCHDDQAAPVLGVSALQLSPDRDPRAPHAEPPPAGAVDVPTLVARGLVRGLAPALRAPRIEARTPEERAALGYLHANCSACHNGRGALASLGLRFDQPPTGDRQRVVASTVDQPSRFRPAGGAAVARIAPGDPAGSTLVHRMRSRSPLEQMPPLATSQVDDEGARLIEDWIRQLATERRKDDGP